MPAQANVEFTDENGGVHIGSAASGRLRHIMRLKADIQKREKVKIVRWTIKWTETERNRRSWRER